MFDNLREVQPLVFFGVPRVWEKVFSTVTKLRFGSDGKLNVHLRCALQHLRAADGRVRPDPALQPRRVGHGGHRHRRAQHPGL